MSQRGEVSLTGLLMACTLLIVILGATMSMFEGFTAEAGQASRRTDAEDVARAAADRIARDLRNLSSPTPDQPRAVDYATATDLVFKTVDPAGPNAGTNATNTERVRYCLDSARRLQQQTQTWTTATTPAVPSTASCPATGWSTTTVAAASIFNTTTPLFSYDATALTDISQVHLMLQVNIDPTRPSGATDLSTEVFLRNQNRRPTALMMSATPTSGGFILNGSASTDPEGATLTYKWFDGATQIGSGITFTWMGLAAGSPHQVHLEVADPAGMVGVSATQALTA